MFKKSSVFMMLLAASLIGIGSITHQPQNIIGQGQPPSVAQPLQKDSQILAQQPLQQ